MPLFDHQVQRRRATVCEKKEGGARGGVTVRERKRERKIVRVRARG